VARSDLGRRKGNNRSAVDTVLHRIPNTLGDVEEAFFMTSAPSAHIADGRVHGLTKHLQLRLQF
jgi:hypothetical protein